MTKYLHPGNVYLDANETGLFLADYRGSLTETFKSLTLSEQTDIGERADVAGKLLTMEI